jgi:Tfp pilus assembly protein PilE
MKLINKKSHIKKCFTLMELLIIITIIAVLATAVLLLWDPKKQLEKSWDTTRKYELAQLQKVLENWYNNRNCYPRPDEICYTNPTSSNINQGLICYICGKEPNSPKKLSSYFHTLPCDPEHRIKRYLYHVDNQNCPSWYRIYAQFSNVDPSGKEVGCQISNAHPQGICGPSGNNNEYQIYSYGISSQNVDLEKSRGTYQCGIYCSCNPCGEAGGTPCDLRKKIYSTSNCQNECRRC